MDFSIDPHVGKDDVLFKLLDHFCLFFGHQNHPVLLSDTVTADASKGSTNELCSLPHTHFKSADKTLFRESHAVFLHFVDVIP